MQETKKKRGERTITASIREKKHTSAGTIEKKISKRIGGGQGRPLGGKA